MKSKSPMLDKAMASMKRDGLLPRSGRKAMKSLILYGSPKKLALTFAYKQVSDNPPYFVRVEVSQADISKALDKARPMPGETVLNTVEIE